MSATNVDHGLQAILDHLKRGRGFDFTGYKLPSLTRRIGRRMQDLRIQSFAEYLDYLQVHPGEFTALFNTILINVTEFFRNPAIWGYLARQVIPQIIAAVEQERPIRVWSAGCASGEEPYTLAIALAEALGLPAFRERVRIYATDVDEEALATARQATYSTAQIEAVPPALHSRYFTPADGNHRIHTDLRQAVIFGRHDLVHDAPISRIDLLLCRNTLMYFNADTQERVLTRLHFSLDSSGFLVVGKAELLLTAANMFTPIDLKHRVFKRAGRVDVRERLIALAEPGIVAPLDTPGQSEAFALRDAAFETAVDAELLIDRNGVLVMANNEARVLFDLRASDIGRPFRDLTVSYRPVELRSRIEEACSERRPIKIMDVQRQQSDGSVQHLTIDVLPLLDKNELLGVSLRFSDTSRLVILQQQLKRANESLRSAYEDLETMNEELQSSNEELRVTNELLAQKSAEVTRANAYLESIPKSLHTAAIIVDAELRVQHWTAIATALWGLRADEVINQPLISLDIGLPVGEVEPLIRAALAGTHEFNDIELDAIDRRGKTIKCRVNGAALHDAQNNAIGVTLAITRSEANTDA